MTITYTPEIGEKPVTTTTTKIQRGILNLPPVGTPIRATLGDTVIVGTVAKGGEGFELVNVQIGGPKSHWDHTLKIELWIGAGWVIELTDGATS
jgi:hypothetical protein